VYLSEDEVVPAHPDRAAEQYNDLHKEALIDLDPEEF
jgi:hypothetical protein